MSRWKFRSLEWIHKVREENYRKTKDDDLKRVIEESVRKVKKSVSH
jgi:hypothetical protein